jgi:hypothetical protein
VAGTATALGGPLWSGGRGGGVRAASEAALIGDPTWGAPLGVLRASLTKASAAGLSTFGRATASHTYGMSKLLHLAEHFDPPPVVHTVVHSWARWLVDVGDAPPGPGASTVPRLPGTHTSLLSGPPATGGFGLIPLAEHLQARHVHRASRFIRWTVGDSNATCPRAQRSLRRPRAAGAPEPTVEDVLLRDAPSSMPVWMHMGADILQTLCPHVPPVLALLSATQPGADPHAGRLAPCLHPPGAQDLPAGPLRRMAVGLRALGEIVPVRPLLFARAPMWQHLPLWGNPHLHIDRPSGSRPGGWPMPLTATPAPPAPDQVFLARMIADNRSGALAEVVASGLCPAALGGATTLGMAVAARTGASVPASMMLRAAIPEQCRAGAMAGGGDDAADARDATREVVDSLGWRASADSMAVQISLADHSALRVKRVTRQLLAPARRVRACRQGEFVDSAFVGDSGRPADAAERAVEVTALGVAMAGLWRVLWVNQSKDTYWRLAAHGVRHAGGHDVPPPRGDHCPCGWAPSPAAPGTAQALQAREHYFWSCPVAASVVVELQHGLGLPVADGPSRADVWLLRPPAAAVVASGLHTGAWAVVCAAAVDAMERGRRRMWASVLGPPAAGLGRTPAGDAAAVTVAGRRAAAEFWSLLQDFVGVGQFPAAWGVLPGNHPFFGCLSYGGEQRTVLNRPPVPAAL